VEQVLTLLWLGGTLLRVWQQARFFQIEEYKSGRYLRWLVARPTRYIMWRALIFVGVAYLTSVALNFAGQDSEALYLAVWSVAAVLSVWPERPKEVKKKFRLTQRAARLLITALGLVVLVLVGAAAIIGELVSHSETTRFTMITLVGLATFHLCPLFLPLANQIMYPVEAMFRGMFVRRARRTLRQKNPVVIGITGSFGKTSTKEYLAHFLRGRWQVLATPKSYNTLMGVCLSINNDMRQCESLDYFVVEMGAYVEGEIARICALTHPKIGIITAVGPQHLERFGSLENTAKAKYELIAALPADGVGVFNWDNVYTRSMYERGYPETRIAVTWENADHATQLRFSAQNIAITPDGMAFDVVDNLTGEKQRIQSPVIGQHNVTNILLAAAVARHLGMSLNEIALRAASLEPAEHRLQRKTLPGGITVIDDAYSANPVGARNALNVLALHTTGRRILITPGMVELGPLQTSENEELGRFAASRCTDVVLVGIEQTKPIARGLHAAGFPADRLHVYDTRDEAIAWFNRELREGDTVLFLNDLPDTYL